MALIFDPSTDYDLENLNWLNFRPIPPEIGNLNKNIETHYALDESVHVPLPAQCKIANGHNYTDDITEQIDLLGIAEVKVEDKMRYFGGYEAIQYQSAGSYDLEQSSIQTNSAISAGPGYGNQIKYLRVDTTDMMYQRSDKRIFSTNIILKSITPAQLDSAISIAQYFEKFGYGPRTNNRGLSSFVTGPPPMWAVWVNSGPAPSVNGHSNFFLRLNHAFMVNCATQTQGDGQDTPYSIEKGFNSGPLIVTIQLAFSEVQSAYRHTDNQLRNRSSAQ